MDCNSFFQTSARNLKVLFSRQSFCNHLCTYIVCHNQTGFVRWLWRWPLTGSFWWRIHRSQLSADHRSTIRRTIDNSNINTWQPLKSLIPYLYNPIWLNTGNPEHSTTTTTSLSTKAGVQLCDLYTAIIESSCFDQAADTRSSSRIVRR